MSLPKLVATDPLEYNQIMVQTKHGVLRRSAGMPIVIQIATQLMGAGKLSVEESLLKAQLLIDTYNESYIFSQDNKAVPSEQVETSIKIDSSFKTYCTLSGEEYE